MPRYEDLDWRGLADPVVGGADERAAAGRGFTPERFAELMSIDREAWMREILSHDELFVTLYDRLPKELLFVRELIASSLWRAPARWGLCVPQRPSGLPAAAIE
jgi:phosphoenolpyruvate carboxykinase (GTP)